MTTPEQLKGTHVVKTMMTFDDASAFRDWLINGAYVRRHLERATVWTTRGPEILMWQRLGDKIAWTAVIEVWAKDIEEGAERRQKVLDERKSKRGSTGCV